MSQLMCSTQGTEAKDLNLGCIVAKGREGLERPLAGETRWRREGGVGILLFVPVVPTTGCYISVKWL